MTQAARSPDPSWLAAIRACRRCHDHGLVHVEPDGRAARPLVHEEGDLHARVLFLLEAPNWDDTYDPAKGKLTVHPDTDPSGRFFFERLADIGLKPEDVYVCNSVLCLPNGQNGKYPVKAPQRRACSPHLRTIVEQVDPDIVVPLGRQALAALKLVEAHDRVLAKHVATATRWFRRRLFPMYHPSALGRMTRSTAQQIEDYRALRVALDWLPAGTVRPLAEEIALSPEDDPILDVVWNGLGRDDGR